MRPQPTRSLPAPPSDPGGLDPLRRQAVARWEALRRDLAQTAVTFHQVSEELHPLGPQAWSEPAGASARRP